MAEWKQQGWIRDVAALALLLFLCLLFFWPILTPRQEERASFRAGDFYVQTYACKTYQARELAHGRFPLWNPYVYSGHPFLADVQNSPLYPPSLLTILLSGPGGYSVLWLEREAVAHFFLAAMFTYFFARRLFRRRSVALLVAVVFTFGGYLTSFPPLQLPILETAVWLPLILLLLDLGSDELGTRRPLAFLYFLLAGAVWGLAILAGHPQTAMYLFYVAAAWYVFRVFDAGRVGPLARIGGFVAFAGAGGGLAAGQLLPAAELMRLSIRAVASYQDLASGFAPQDLLQIVLPGVAGYWSPLYVGILPLAWAFFAWLAWFRRGEPRPARRWRRDVAFWTALAVVALLLALGDETFFYSLFYLGAPGFGLFRAQERVALVFSLSLALLSGYGLTYFFLLAEGGARRVAHTTLSKLLLGLLGGMGIVVLLTFGGQTQFVGEASPLWSAFMGLALFLSLMLGLAWLGNAFLSRFPWRPGLVVGGLLILIVLDLFTLQRQTNFQNRRPERQVQSSPLIQTLQAAEGDRPFRVHHGGWHLPGNYGCVFALEDTIGASQLHLADYARFLERVPQERAWELLNVRYVVTWQAALNVPSQVVYQTTTRRGDEVYLHRLANEIPRAWAVFRAEVVTEDQALERLSQPDLARYELALLAAPLAAPLSAAPEEGASLRWITRSPEKLRLQVEMPARGLVVFSELYYPGWQATVDGRRVPIHRADAILRAVEAPAGSHQIEMVYRPLSVYLGAAISLLTSVSILGYTIWVWANLRRKGQGATHLSRNILRSRGGYEKVNGSGFLFLDDGQRFPGVFSTRRRSPRGPLARRGAGPGRKRVGRLGSG